MPPKCSKCGQHYWTGHPCKCPPPPPPPPPLQPGQKVLVEAVVKCKANGAKAVLLSADDPAGVWIAGAGWKTYRNIHDNYLLELTRPSGSTPGTYGVCGVEE